MKARIHRTRPAHAAKREAHCTPTAVGVLLGVLILCRYWTCCIFRHLRGDFDSDLGHHQLFKHCCALDLCVPRSVVGCAGHGGSGAGRARQVPHEIRANTPRTRVSATLTLFQCCPLFPRYRGAHSHSDASAGSKSQLPLPTRCCRSIHQTTKVRYRGQAAAGDGEITWI